MNARPQFSIKDLLWLMTLIGIGVGWYLDHRAATVREEADWDALTTLDYGLQGHPQSMKEFQGQLDQLEREASELGSGEATPQPATR